MKNKKTKSQNSNIESRGIKFGTGKKYLKNSEVGDPFFSDEEIAKDFEDSINNPD